jgi:hypothetical protein
MDSSEIEPLSVIVSDPGIKGSSVHGNPDKNGQLPAEKRLFLI